ncbi:MAG: transposase [Acidobacteria bacterium]|nr:transposase [Acidobacteriota bacterium]
MYSRKNIRLDHKNYLGQTAIFVTLCCYRRRPHFTSSALCLSTLEILRETATTRNFAVHAYCFMPDHLHQLVECLSPDSDFLNFMQALRVRSTRHFSNSNRMPLWQRYFFDHILRETDAFESVCLYIWANPVRAGLTRRRGEFPFAGSYTRDLPSTCPTQSCWQPSKTKKGPSQKMAPTRSPLL